MLKDLRKCLESEKKDESLFDIVVYGSFVRGEDYRDVDIAFIFRHGSLRERLERMQKAKSRLGNLKISVDAKAFLLEELFSSSNFARQGIFLDGLSLFDGKCFSEKIGFKPYALFSYSLKDKKHSEKVKFNYLLAGRNAKGIIELLDGKRISAGTIKIPSRNSAEMEKLLSDNNIKFEKLMVLEES